MKELSQFNGIDFSVFSDETIKYIRNTNINEKVLTDFELRNTIISYLKSRKEYADLSSNNKVKLIARVFYSLRGMDVLTEYIADKTITEIMINKYDEIFIERRGRLYRLNEQFDNEDRLYDFIYSILGKMNKSVNELSPIVDSRLVDGSRVHVVLPPISLKGPTLNIRKFPEKSFKIDDLVAMGTMSVENSMYLREAVANKKNIFISGGTGTGKTTLLNALASCISNEERVITIEDTSELKIEGLENLVSLETRANGIDGNGIVTIKDLIRAALRMRPNRIIVGEVRGPEVIDMLAAMNTGHEGSLSTGHSNSPIDLISRIETMALSGTNLSLDVIRKLIVSSLDIIIHLERDNNGARMIKSIYELDKNSRNEINLNLIISNNVSSNYEE